MFQRAYSEDAKIAELESVERAHTDVEMFPEVRGHFNDMSKLENYVKGGRGIVTLHNPKSGNHRSYEFRRPNNPEDFLDDTLFVYVLTSDNIWLYVGMYSWRTKYFRLTRASRFSYKHEIVKGIIYLIKMIRGEKPNTIMQVWHEGVCSVCGRKLTTPKSVMWGIGPRCRKAIEAVR